MPQSLATAVLTEGTPEAAAIKAVVDKGSKAMAEELVTGTLPACVVALLVCSGGARGALTGSQGVEKIKAWRPKALRALCREWVKEMVDEKDGWELDDAENEELVQLTASMLEGRTDLATCEVLARVVYQKVLKASTVALSEEEGEFFRLDAKSREKVPSSIGLSPKTAKLMSKIWTVVYKAVALADVEHMRALFEYHHELLAARLNSKLGKECIKTSLKLQDGIKRAFAHVRAGESPTLALKAAPEGKVGVFEEHLAAFEEVKEKHKSVVPNLRVSISHQQGRTPPDAYALRYNRLTNQADIWGDRPDELEHDSWTKRQKTTHQSPSSQLCRDHARATARAARLADSCTLVPRTRPAPPLQAPMHSGRPVRCRCSLSARRVRWPAARAAAAAAAPAAVPGGAVAGTATRSAAASVPPTATPAAACRWITGRRGPSSSSSSRRSNRAPKGSRSTRGTRR